MQGYIYLIENKINGHKYVGMTQVSLEQRWKEHLQDCSKKKTESRPLHMAIRKYGEENFSISLIEECDTTILTDREIFWIEHYNTYKKGYNATIGGEGKTYYDWDKIIELYFKCFCIKIVAQTIGCSSDTVIRVLTLKNIARNLELERSFETGNSVIAKQNGEIIKIFPSQLKAAQWIKDQGKTIITDLRKISYVIGRAVRGLDNRTQAYGYQWIKISPEEYVLLMK